MITNRKRQTEREGERERDRDRERERERERNRMRRIQPRNLLNAKDTVNFKIIHEFYMYHKY